MKQDMVLLKLETETRWPNLPPSATPVGVPRLRDSACAVDITGPAWLSSRRQAALHAMRWFILIFLSACCACHHPQNWAQGHNRIAPDKSEIVNLHMCDFDRSTYFFQTTRDTLRKTPKWKSSANYPPLPPRKAMKLALNEAKHLRPDVLSWSLMTISLKQIFDGDDEYWIYVVALHRTDIVIFGVPEFSPDLDVPILMSGQAVHPTTNPRKK